MDQVGILAIVSTLISSVALVGVAASLVIQTRQLRTSQLQATRAAQAEVVRISLENPRLFVHDARTGADRADLYALHAYTNLIFKYLELGFEIGVVSEPSVRAQVAVLFESAYRRRWWASARRTYAIEAATRRERRFAQIVENEFEKWPQDSAPPQGGGTTNAGKGVVQAESKGDPSKLS
jgi:hypothetical protein